MSIEVTRSVVVDDTDPNIHYMGVWAQISDDTDSPSTFGRSEYETPHGSNQKGSITYLFSGFKIMVVAAFRNTTIGATPAGWTCLIDGRPIASQSFPYPQNRWPICEDDGLKDGPHNITVLTEPRPGEEFWFDAFQYAPSRDVPLDNADIYFDSSDPVIKYEGGWQPYSQGLMTISTGASLKMTFHGVSATWTGILPGSISVRPTTATYSIDGNVSSSGTVVVQGTSSPNDVFNHILFQTPVTAFGRTYTARCVQQEFVDCASGA